MAVIGQTSLKPVLFIIMLCSKLRVLVAVLSLLIVSMFTFARADDLSPASASISDANQPDAPVADVTHLLDHLQPGATLQLTLPEAIAIALRKNPSVEQAYTQRVLDKLSLQIAQQQFVPQLTLTGDTSSQMNQPLNNNTNSATLAPGVEWTSPFGTTVQFAWNNTLQQGGYNGTASINFNQPLLQGFGIDLNEVNLNNAYDTELQARFTLKAAIINIVNTIIADYRALQQQEMSLASDQLALKNYQQTVKDTEAYIKAGTKAPSEIYQTQSAVAKQQLQIQNDLISLATAQAQLDNDLGINNQAKIVVPTDILIPHVIPDEALSEKLALENDLTYLGDMIALRIAKRNLLTAQDQTRWQVNLTASLNAQNIANTQPNQAVNGGGTANGLAPFGANGILNNSSNTFGLNVNIPVGTQQRLQNEQSLASAKIAIQNAQINLATEQRNELNQIRVQIETIKIDLANIALAKQAVDLAHKTVQITQKKVAAGLASNFELSTEQQNEVNARTALIAAEISYLNALANFDKTLGTTLYTWHITVIY